MIKVNIKNNLIKKIMTRKMLIRITSALVALTLLAMISFLVYVDNCLDKQGIQYNRIKFVFQMLLGGDYNDIRPELVKKIMNNPKQDFIIMDIRTKDKFIKSHIDKAVSYPFKELEKKKNKLIKTNAKIVLVCDQGGLSKVAAAILNKQGYKFIYRMLGGMEGWQNERSN